MTHLSPLTVERLKSLEAAVRDQNRGDNQRVAELVSALITHSHAFVRETRPTPEEWAAVVDFLIRMGRSCTDQRNEFILLSDMLGLTSAVDEVNFPGVADATPSSVEGPFHAAAPERANGDWIANGPERDRACLAVFRGVVADVRGGPIAGALVDVWQADDAGHYDSQDPRQDRGNLRGLFRTDDRGEFSFRTVVPSSYPVPTDGPAGELLRAMGRHPMRPAHFHLRVAASGFRAVTTHVFVAGDPYLASDAAFAVKPELVVEPRRLEDGSMLFQFPLKLVRLEEP